MLLVLSRGDRGAGITVAWKRTSNVVTIMQLLALTVTALDEDSDRSSNDHDHTEEGNHRKICQYAPKPLNSKPQTLNSKNLPLHHFLKRPKAQPIMQ